MNATTPFALLDLEPIEMADRGYLPYPNKISYDPKSQTTDILNLGGKTEPTTTSGCADTTGIFDKDDDTCNDDTGTD